MGSLAVLRSDSVAVPGTPSGRDPGGVGISEITSALDRDHPSHLEQLRSSCRSTARSLTPRCARRRRSGPSWIPLSTLAWVEPTSKEPEARVCGGADPREGRCLDLLGIEPDLGTRDAGCGTAPKAHGGAGPRTVQCHGRPGIEPDLGTRDSGPRRVSGARALAARTGMKDGISRDRARRKRVVCAKETASLEAARTNPRSDHHLP